MNMSSIASSSSSTMTSPKPSTVPDLSGSVFLISSDGRVINLPIPSQSPRDPLNWSPARRNMALFTIIFFFVIAALQIEGPALMLTAITQEFTVEEMRPFPVRALITAPGLCEGIGAFLWIPLSLAIGRRPVFLFCSALMALSSIGAALSPSFHGLMLAVCVVALSGGLATSTALLMLIDVTFIHQRVLVISAFFSIGAVAKLILLSIVPDLMNAPNGWRAFYYFLALPSICACVMVFFFFPESYFVRSAVAFDGHILHQTATEGIKIYKDWEEVPGGKSLPDVPEPRTFFTKVKHLSTFHVTPGGWRAMADCYPQILMCILNPLILWVATLNAVVFSSMTAIGYTFQQNISGSPYSLPVNVALVNLAGAGGALLAWPASGAFISCISRHLTTRNGGVRDAEHYLPAFILPILAGAGSVIVNGLAVEKNWGYLSLYAAYAMNTFATVCLGAASTLWVTEAFPRWAAPALVIVGGGSYVASFGLSFAIAPWITNVGAVMMHISLGLLILAVGALAIPIALWGKPVRLWIHERWGMKSESGALRPQ